MRRFLQAEMDSSKVLKSADLGDPAKWGILVDYLWLVGGVLRVNSFAADNP
jgi:hypothetical protein